MFLDDDGNVTDRSLVGHLASGVPGSVMGLWEGHRRFGTLAWADLVEPAAALADSFVVHERFRDNILSSEQGIRQFETTAATFLPGGRIVELGETFRQPELAATLRRIRDQGPVGFYGGKTADLIVAEMERGGGLITHRDLEAYTAVWRDPIKFTYRGYEVLSMPPSSSGGATMAEMANILEEHDLGALPWHSGEMVHLLTEVVEAAGLKVRGLAARNGSGKGLPVWLTDSETMPEGFPEKRLKVRVTRSETSLELASDKAGDKELMATAPEGVVAKTAGNKKDPRLSATVTNSEIMKHGTRVL